MTPKNLKYYVSFENKTEEDLPRRSEFLIGEYNYSAVLVKDGIGSDTTGSIHDKTFEERNKENLTLSVIGSFAAESLPDHINGGAATTSQPTNDTQHNIRYNETLDSSKRNEADRVDVEKLVVEFLRLIETQHILGSNCTAGTDLNLGDGVVDRYAQERFRIEADVAVNRANMLTRLWKYAPEVMQSEYLLHASVFSMVEFTENIFAAGNCYDQYNYKDYQLFCPFAYRLPEGLILVKDLAVEYKYLSRTSEWFYIARKNAEKVIQNYNQFSRGFNTYTFNASAHTARIPDEILSVTYEDGKWSKPYFDCGGGNIWMLTYTVPFFGYTNGTYYFKGTSGIDIDLRRVDIDQCPMKPGYTQINIFAATDKCKKRTTECIPIPGLGFRRGSYKCVCKRGYFFPNVTESQRYYNGTIIEELYVSSNVSYFQEHAFECLQCAEGCDECLDGSPCVAALNWVIRTTIFILACLIIGCLPFIVAFTIKYGHVKIVRAASPALLRMIALGALLIYSTTLIMYGTPTTGSCTAKVWLREVGFCLTYGALMLKTWRISVIFQVRSAKAVKITDMNLLRRVGVIVGLACVLLSIRTLVAPPTVIVGKTKEGLKAYLCNTDWWDHSFSILEVVFLIWGIRLCIMVRKAPSEFNESRFISMAIYNEFLLSVFLNISMLFLQSPANPDLLYIIFFCHTQLTVTLLLCFIFGSKAYLVLKVRGKDHNTTGRKKTVGNFAGKQRATESNYTMKPESNQCNIVDNMTEHDLEMEYRRLYNQLEKLREKGGCVARRIATMQEAVNKYDAMLRATQGTQASSLGGGLKFNTVLHAVADKLMCAAVTPAEESTSSGREISNADTTQNINSRKNTMRLHADSSTEQTSLTNVRGHCKADISEVNHPPGNGGVFKISGESACADVKAPETIIVEVIDPTCSVSNYKNKQEKKKVMSGHARTHAIVINLDDKSRFTEEVTV